MGLEELAKFRRQRDQAALVQVELSEMLAQNMVRHFAPEETETAGRALIIGGAHIAALAECTPAVLVNVLTLAGQRMVLDSRAAREAGA